MELIFWWLGVLLIIVFSAITFYRWGSLRQSKNNFKYKLAHTKSFTQLPEYKLALKNRQITIKLATLFLIFAILGSILTSSRFVSDSLNTPSSRSRDIMLCLDVSGSVQNIDIPIMKSFDNLVNKLKGERIGLTVFNTSPLTLIPLTDDYKSVQSVINSNLSNNLQNIELTTADPENVASSQIGAGLLSCAHGFDNQTQIRSRSIILATDNDTGLPAIINFPQAALYAKQHDIHIFSLDTKTSSSLGTPVQNSAELKQAAIITGGDYYDLTAGVPINQIVQKIQSQQETLAKSLPRTQNSDQPLVPVTITFLSFIIYLGIAWRFKL